ncbi:MAG: menD [Crocinitomicaceae bacterium]|jgi:2-succinyl-5-enolpyruvyl-6-hydroxy-3-cyclohexene-1-carboxylate synthase|nr:menD [Crocinitomicaceae bacterium]
MHTSSKKNVQLLVSACVELGLKHVVVSPGSRNAPLIIAFNRHPEIECIVVPDERSAAFFALGMAQQTSGLVALLCTSGSAPLNYYPAVAEAYYQRVPLLIFTADRPQTWVNQGDGQTIVQHELYKNHINHSLTIDDTITHPDYAWYISRELSKAVNYANGVSKGPVHINVAFTEPLYQQTELTEAPDGKTIRFENPKKELTTSQLTHISASWAKYEKKMIVCGQLAPDAGLLHELRLLAKNDSSVAILVENTSNLVDPGFVHCIDRTLNAIEEEEQYSPDLLIYIGGAVVSKRIKAFLRKNASVEHWKVGEDFPDMDTFQQMTHSFDLKPQQFLHSLNKLKIGSASSFGVKWKQLDYLVQEKTKHFFEATHILSDLHVFNILLDSVPENSSLHLANSSVIRYSLLFDPVQSIRYWCNRGTSGIDGSTSTAAGHAYLKKESWNTLITGDMSFFYDSNAFWNHLLTPNLRIFLINNGGGSIFKIIPGPDSTAEQDDFFVYNNTFQAEHICKTFHVGYHKANSLEDIETQLHDFYTYEEKGRPKLMEIFTASADNENILKEFFRKVKI